MYVSEVSSAMVLLQLYPFDLVIELLEQILKIL